MQQYCCWPNFLFWDFIFPLSCERSWPFLQFFVANNSKLLLHFNLLSIIFPKYLISYTSSVVWLSIFMVIGLFNDFDIWKPSSLMVDWCSHAFYYLRTNDNKFYSDHLQKVSISTFFRLVFAFQYGKTALAK